MKCGLIGLEAPGSARQHDGVCRAVGHSLTALTPVSLPLLPPAAWSLLLARCAVLAVCHWQRAVHHLLDDRPRQATKAGRKAGVCAQEGGRGADRQQQTHTAAAAAACVCQQAPQPADACADLGGTDCSSDRIVCCALHYSGIPLLQEAGPTAWIRSVALRVCVADTHTQLLVSPYVVVAAAAARSPQSTLWPSSMCWAMC